MKTTTTGPDRGPRPSAPDAGATAPTVDEQHAVAAGHAGSLPARRRRGGASWPGVVGFGVTEVVVAAALVALVLATGIVRSESLSAGNLENIAIAAIPLVVLAVGQLLVIATGGIDLSVGSTFSLVGMVTAAVSSHGQGLGVSVAAGLGTGLLVGIVNGFCVAWWGLAPFVVTLVTLSVGASLAFVVTGGNSVPLSDPAFADIWYGSTAGLPNYFVIPAVLVVVVQLGLSFLVFGRWIFATGSNPRAAALVGIPTRRVLMTSYVASSLCAALASVLVLSYLANAEVTSGSGLELSAIAAVVIGGASLFGGRGSAVGALLGALIITAIQNTVNLLGINTFWQGTVTGVVILLAVLADRVTAVVRSRRGPRPATPRAPAASGPVPGTPTTTRTPA